MQVFRSLLLVAIGAAAMWIFLGGQRGPELVATARATASPAVPATVQQQVSSVGKALAQAKQTGRPVAVTLTLAQQDLNAAASAYFPQTYSAFTLTDPQVQLGSGQVKFTAAASVLALRSTAVVAATPYVVNGRPAVRVDSATIGGAPVPDPVRQGIANDIAGAIASQVPPNLVVNTIVVANGVLTVQGVANP